jgi:hypothetical protein
MERYRIRDPKMILRTGLVALILSYPVPRLLAATHPELADAARGLLLGVWIGASLCWLILGRRGKLAGGFTPPGSRG